MKYATVRTLLIPFFRPLIVRIADRERIPEPPYVIAANHVDFLDGFYLATAFFQAKGHSVYFIAKTNNYGWTRAILPIDPDRPGKVLERAVDYLRRGKVICNFVEGERNPRPTLLPGKTGAVRLALAAGVPILPVGLNGLRGSTYFASSLWQWLTWQQRVTLTIGEPLLVPTNRQPTNGELHRLTTLVMQRLAPLCGKTLGPSPSEANGLE